MCGLQASPQVSSQLVECQTHVLERRRMSAMICLTQHEIDFQLRMAARGSSKGNCAGLLLQGQLFRTPAHRLLLQASFLGKIGKKSFVEVPSCSCPPYLG